MMLIASDVRIGDTIVGYNDVRWEVSADVVAVSVFEKHCSMILLWSDGQLMTGCSFGPDDVYDVERSADLQVAFDAEASGRREVAERLRARTRARLELRLIALGHA